MGNVWFVNVVKDFAKLKTTPLYGSFTVCIVLLSNLFVSVLFIVIVTAVVTVALVWGLKSFNCLF